VLLSHVCVLIAIKTFILKINFLFNNTVTITTPHLRFLLTFFLIECIALAFLGFDEAETKSNFTTVPSFFKGVAKVKYFDAAPSRGTSFVESPTL
jgi:hypothetical protein